MIILFAFLAEVEAKPRRPLKKASHALESSFLETTQAVSDEDIGNILALPFFCLADLTFEPAELEYIAGYCHDVYEPYWRDTYSHFPEDYDGDDDGARENFIMRTDSIFFMLYAKLECDF